jgi:succinyl-CoA synthetase beta subunit
MCYYPMGIGVGYIANGAGLALATMDMISDFGGKPANFLDIGGAASSESVAKSFVLLTQNIQVKCILITIFGGIIRCDDIAVNLVQIGELKEIGKPVVIRFAGNRWKEAEQIIKKSRVFFYIERKLDSAIKLAVSLSQQKPQNLSFHN